MSLSTPELLYKFALIETLVKVIERISRMNVKNQSFLFCFIPSHSLI